MSNILLISLFGSTSGSNNRIVNILSVLKGDNDTSFICSDFSHGSKCYKTAIEHDNNSGIKEIRLHVPAYERNLSIRRIYSHLCFAKALKKYLYNLEIKPDLVYCTMPSSSSAYIAGKWCKKNKIPFIIDVIDIWPDSLIPIMPMKRIVEVLLYPWYHISYKSYEMADYISAESRQYMEIAKRNNGSAPSSYTYLGVDCNSVRHLISKSSLKLEKPNDELWLCYGGSLGHSYDFDSILAATDYIHKKGIKYHLWFVGDGEKREYIEESIRRLGINATVTGRVEYGDLLKYLSLCDIAFNSFNPQTLVVHSYKFNDYISTGCFIMNSLKGETAELIDRYQIGMNYTQKTISHKLYDVCKNWQQISVGLQERIAVVIDKYLDKDTIYKRLSDDIQKQVTIFSNKAPNNIN